VRLCFITATPLNVFQGSGTFAGIDLLARTLRGLGVEVDVLSPQTHFPIYTLQRLWFNWTLPHRVIGPYHATVGFDMDGYTLARAGSAVHVACIKGVIADECRFERGLTWATMRIQAACEQQHVRRASRVIATSEYSSRKITKFYRPPLAPLIVPELIDLEAWGRLSARCQPPAASDKFVVLSVCRFYRRKRLDVLLAAAERLRDRIRNLEVRIVGGGPERDHLTRLWRQKGLQNIVVWREDIGEAELAQEYMRCDVFCLPSVQEGFGIVFLEAMAHGKPIVACRAGATPEVVPHALMARPDDPDELADAIDALYQQKDLRRKLGTEGREVVQKYDAPRIAQMFLHQIESLARGDPA
jgi:glycosyltransferase involved in cell wall biosynthesis